MDPLEQFKKQRSVPAQIIEMIEADADYKAGFIKAYEEQRDKIKDLPYRQQFEIVLATLSFGISAVREYQNDQLTFRKKLDQDQDEKN